MIDNERTAWDDLYDLTKEFSEYFPFNLTGKELDIDGDKHLITKSTFGLATHIYEIDMLNFSTGEKTRYTGNQEGVIKEEILEPALI